MKTFLNIVGLLALVGGVLGALLDPLRGGIILGAGLLQACVCLGLAKIIEHLAQGLKHDAEWHKQVLEALALLRPQPPMLPVPRPPSTADKFQIALEGEVLGHYTLDELRKLHARGALSPHSHFIAEGMSEWRPIAELTPRLA